MDAKEIWFVQYMLVGAQMPRLGLAIEEHEGVLPAGADKRSRAPGVRRAGVAHDDGGALGELHGRCAGAQVARPCS